MCKTLRLGLRLNETRARFDLLGSPGPIPHVRRQHHPQHYLVSIAVLSMYVLL